MKNIIINFLYGIVTLSVILGVGFGLINLFMNYREEFFIMSGVAVFGALIPFMLEIGNMVRNKFK